MPIISRMHNLPPVTSLVPPYIVRASAPSQTTFLLLSLLKPAQHASKLAILLCTQHQDAWKPGNTGIRTLLTYVRCVLLYGTGRYQALPHGQCCAGLDNTRLQSGRAYPWQHSPGNDEFDTRC